MNLVSKNCEIQALKDLHKKLIYILTEEEIVGYENNYDIFKSYIQTLSSMPSISSTSILLSDLSFYLESLSGEWTRLAPYRQALSIAEGYIGNYNNLIEELSLQRSVPLHLEASENTFYKSHMSLIEGLVREEASILYDASVFNIDIATDFSRIPFTRKEEFISKSIALLYHKEIVETKEKVLGQMMTKNKSFFPFENVRKAELLVYISVLDSLYGIIDDVYFYYERSIQEKFRDKVVSERERLLKMHSREKETRELVLSMTDKASALLKEPLEDAFNFINGQQSYQKKQKVKRNMVYYSKSR